MIFEPFGGLVILALIAVALIAGLTVAIVGRKSKRTLSMGVLIIAAPWMLLLLLAALSPHEIDEWNPSIHSDSEIIGEWKIDGSSVTIQPDSSFAAAIQGDVFKGNWIRKDWNLFLTDMNGAEHQMRFVQDRGELILLPNLPEHDHFAPGTMALKRSEPTAAAPTR